MNLFSKMSLFKKIFITIISFFILLIISIIVLQDFFHKNFLKNEILQDSQLKNQQINTIIHEFQENAITITTLLGYNENVIRAYNSDNLEEGAQILIDKVQPLIDSVNALSDHEIRVHFHKPGALSLYRSWTDQRFDSLCNFRESINIIDEDHKPLTCIELGRGGFAIRGITPVFDNGEFIGTIELFSDFTQIEKYLDFKKEDFSIIFLVDSSYANDLFFKDELTEKYPHAFERWQASENPKKFPNISAKQIEIAINTNKLQTDIHNNTSVSYLPIMDLKNAPVGLVVYCFDYSNLAQLTKATFIKLIVIVSILSTIVFLFSIWVLRKTIVKPINEIEDSIEQLAKGKISFENEISNVQTDEHSSSDEIYRLKTSIVKMQTTLREVFNSTYDAIVLHHFNGDIVDANNVFLEMFGVERSQLNGLNIKEISSDKNDFSKLEVYWQENAKNKDQFFEWHCRRIDDNTEFFGEVYLRRINVLGQNIAFANVRDITEHKESADKLKESESLYRSLLKAIPDAITVSDPNGTITYVSDKAVEIFGFDSADEIIGSNAIDWIVPEDHGRAKENISKVFSFNQGFDNTYELIRKDGKRFYGSIKSSVFYDKEDNIKGMISITRDITDQIMMNNSLIESERELELRNKIANIFLTSDEDKVYSETLHIILETIQSDLGFFGYINEDGDLVSPTLTEHVWSGKCQMTRQGIVFPKESWTGLWGNSLINKRTYMSNNKLNPPEGHLDLHNAIASPIIYHDELIGQIAIANKLGGYNEKDVELLESICNYISTILYEKLENQRQQKIREEVELALRKKEETYRIVVEQTGQIVFEWDLINDNFSWLGPVEDILLYPMDGLTTMTNELWQSLIHPDDLPQAAENYRNAFETNGKLYNEYRVRRNDGKYIYIELNGVFLHNEENTEKKLLGTLKDVSKRKEMEEYIKNQNKFLLDIINSLPYPFYVINVKDYSIVLANTAGAEEASEEGTTCYQVSHKKSQPCNTSLHPCPMEVVKSTKKPYIVEHLHFDREGSPINVEVHGYPILNEDGEITEFIEFAIDITKRKQIEVELKESQEKYKKLFDEAIDAIFVIDAEEGNIIDCNIAAEELIEMSRIEIINQHFELLKLELDDFASTKDFIFSTRLNDSRVHEGIIQNTYGIKKHITIKKNHLELKGKLFVQAIFRDISVRKMAEAEINLKAKLLDAANETIFLTYKDEFIYFNENAFKSRGFNSRDFLKMSLYDIVDEAQRRNYKDNMKIALSKGKHLFESTHVCKDGSKMEVEISASTIEYQEKIHVLSIIRDITMSKIIQNELEDAKLNAEEANKAKSEFLANMSHEIRTPMNSILGFGEILQNNTQNKENRNMIRTVMTSGKTLLALLNDILDLSKIEAGKLDLHYDYINVRQTLFEMQSIFSHKVSQKDIEFFLEIDENMPGALYLDQIRLRQILFNLVGNAIKFTDNGYVKLKSTHEKLDKDSVNLTISVEDTGIGINEEEQNSIFEAFRQQSGQNAQVYGGTGLGLAITKRLVELMNGSIILKSQPNKGSQFSIIIPNVKSSSKQFSKQILRDGKSTEIIFKNATILVVDDFVENRQLIKAFLSNSDLHFLEASNGNTAFEMIKTEKPDIVLLDLKMPGLSGEELLKLIKSDDELKSIKVIIQSASLTMEQEVLNLGAEAFIKKPILKKQFFSTLKKYIDYEEISSDDVDEIEETIDKKFTPNDLDSIKIEPKPNNEQIFKKFVIEFWKEYDKVKRSSILNDITDFANKCIEFGSSNNIELIRAYGEKLSEAAKSFNFNNIEDILNYFSTLIKRLKTE